MKVIQRKLKLKEIDYYLTHLRLINAVLEVKLTETQIEVLAAFMSLDHKITGTDMFNTYARKLVKTNLNMSAASLSNHLGALLVKQFLVKDEITGRIHIKEYFLPEDNAQGYQFGIIKEKDEA